MALVSDEVKQIMNPLQSISKFAKLIKFIKVHKSCCSLCRYPEIDPCFILSAAITKVIKRTVTVPIGHHNVLERNGFAPPEKNTTNN
jgi:hypothetical protein